MIYRLDIAPNGGRFTVAISSAQMDLYRYSAGLLYQSSVTTSDVEEFKSVIDSVKSKVFGSGARIYWDTLQLASPGVYLVDVKEGRR